MKTDLLIAGSLAALVVGGLVLLSVRNPIAELPPEPPRPPEPLPPSPTPPAPQPAPQPAPPLRFSRYPDLPLGTYVIRKGWPTGFFEPRWQIIAKSPPTENTIFSGDAPSWNYVVQRVPAPPIGTESTAYITGYDIEALEG